MRDAYPVAPLSGDSHISHAMTCIRIGFVNRIIYDSKDNPIKHSQEVIKSLYVADTSHDATIDSSAEDVYHHEGQHCQELEEVRQEFHERLSHGCPSRGASLDHHGATKKLHELPYGSL